MLKRRLLKEFDDKGNVSFIDPTTGEVTEENKGRFVWQNQYPKRRGEWFEVLQHDWDSVLMRDWTLTDLRVLLACMRFMENNNELTVKQSTIAEYLQLSRPAVSKSIQALISAGYLDRVERIGYSPKLLVSVHCGWRGAVADGNRKRQESHKKNIDLIAADFFRQEKKVRSPRRRLKANGEQPSV